MKLKWYLLAILFISLQSCNSQKQKINGVSFVAAPDKIFPQHIIPLKKASVNFVSLMPFGFVKSLNDSELKFNSENQWFGETKAGVKQYANEFKKEQIEIMLKPQIWVWRGEFTGKISMESEEDWIAFENAYSKFILAYAAQAEQLNATIFCIGTELENFVISRPKYWKQLIKEIRKVYGGKLTYAANWDEFKRVPFWSDLDFIGIDAYFPLTEKKSPRVKEFELGWQAHKEKIEEYSNKFDKQVLFTEYGYRSVNYTGKQPWDASKIQGEVNLEAQKNATQAIYNQFWNEDWFAGGFLWKWFYNHDQVGGETDNRFTPQNKPTEKLIRKLYAN